ncbi:ADP-heptose:LPS heptosyltransferase [Pseudorhodoplanes sinuspersici]|nr:ADP-heptose:LPS heptosyltransferase [Pseudorhodoplanes sinuspersici]
MHLPTILINPTEKPKRKPKLSAEAVAADETVECHVRLGLIQFALPGIASPLPVLGITGFVLDTGDFGRSVECSLLIDNKPVRDFIANRPNAEGGVAPDLGLGRHAFSLPIPFAFLDGADHNAAVVLKETGRCITTAPIPFCSPMYKTSGHINGIKQLILRGWACFRARPEFPVELTITINGKYKFNVKADQFRKDLQKAGLGGGCCSFSFAIPPSSLRADTENTVTVTYFHSGKIVPDGNIVFVATRAEIEKARASWPKPDLIATERATPIARIYSLFDDERAFAFFREFLSPGTSPADQPKVSIIMPCWNRGMIVHFSIETVLQQSYQNWELIIVDDGSTDDTVDVVKPYLKDKRISLVRVPHGGVSAARNAGLEHSTGEFVAYLDSDNLWTGYYLDLMVRFMQQRHASCAYSGLKVRGDDGVNFRGIDFDWPALLQANYIDLNVFMHRRSLYEELGGFDAGLRRMVDWDLILRYTKHAGAIYAPFIGAEYDNYSRTDRITVSQAGAYAFRVIQKQLIDWREQHDQARIRGRVSIVVPCLENLALTEQCLQSIFANTNGDFEVVIVDNGSGNVVKERLASISRDHPNVRLVSLASNLNFAIGCNVGAAISSGEYLVFLNNDTLVTSRWLEQLLLALKSNEVRGAQPLLLYHDATVQCAGHFFNKYNCLPYHLFQNFPWDHPAVNSPRRVHSVTGACIAVRAAEFISLQGFDPLFVNGGEDVDLCLRMTERFGGHFVVAPESKVYHLESKTHGRGRYIDDNRRLLVQRWARKAPVDDEAVLRSVGFVIGSYSVDREPAVAVSLFKANPLAREYLISKARRILVVKPSGIGNMLLFVPAMSALRSIFPDAKFTVACYAAEAPAIRHLADAVITLKKNPEDGATHLPELEGQIAIGEFDLAVYPPFTNVSRPTPSMKRAIRWHVVHPFWDFASRHELEHNMDIPRMLGYTGPAPTVELPTADVPNLDQVPRPYIAIHVGASATPHMQRKKWPLARWAAVVKTLSSSHYAVFVGGSGEEKDVETTLSLLPTEVRRRCFSFCGELDLTATATVLKGADVVLANDSGLMHLAAAMDRPVIAVFGPTSPEKNAPVAPTAPTRVVRVNVPCGPCFTDRQKLLACQEQICLSSVTPDMVITEFAHVVGMRAASFENV